MELIKKEQIQDISKRLKEGQMPPGIDKINKYQYVLREDEYIDIVLKGINSGKYQFSKYKQLLKLKDANSYPRQISIPVLRDKLMLKVVDEHYLKPLLGERKHVREIVEGVNKDIQSKKYDEFIKIDIEKFFDSIDLRILLAKLKESSVNVNIVKIIEKALKTVTVDIKQNSKNLDRLDETIVSGVKQGITISNSLAEIYLLDFDKKFNNMEGIKYYRFVDDILILYNSKNITKATILNEIKTELELLKLREKITKRLIGKLEKTDFMFLGYLFKNNKISIAPGILHKKEKQIERVIFDFKNLRKKRPIEYLQWKLDLEIKGFVSNGKFYGWLKVYQSLTDLSLLYHLNDVVKKLLARAGYKDKINPISFIKSYHSIRARKADGVVNFDSRYKNVSQKEKFLNDTLSIKTDNLEDEVIENIFNDAVRKLIFEFERDLDFKYGI